MGDSEEKVSFPYRIPESQHRNLKSTAAERGMTMQGFIDAAVEAYLSTNEPARPKALREAHEALDLLYANLDRFAVYWSIVQKVFGDVRKKSSAI